jgi:hypothetical protein
MTNEIKNLAHHKFYLKKKQSNLTPLITTKLINVVEMNLTKESKQLRFNFTTLNYKTVKIVKKVGIH